MHKHDLFTLVLGVFIGFILLSMVSSGIESADFITATIALAALAFTVWQGYTTREHNKLSIKPSLKFCVEVKGEYFSMVIKNVGLGPAKIVSLQRYILEKAVDYSKFHNDFNINVEPNSKWEADEEVRDYILQVNDELTVLLVKHTSKNNKELSRKLFERYGGVVKYASLYGDEFIEDPKHH